MMEVAVVKSDPKAHIGGYRAGFHKVDYVTGSLPQRLLLVESYMPVLKQEQMFRWMWYGFYIIPY